MVNFHRNFKDFIVVATHGRIHIEAWGGKCHTKLFPIFFFSFNKPKLFIIYNICCYYGMIVHMAQRFEFA